jgi:hypothetical protein
MRDVHRLSDDTSVGAGHDLGVGQVAIPHAQTEPFGDVLAEAATVAPAERGSQYTSIRFSERLAEAGIQPSVGAVGSSYDNALAETINGLYKTELSNPASPGDRSKTSR